MLATAAVLEALNEPLVLRTVSLPPLAPYQVLVEMKYSGICRSQINEIKGYKGADPYIPHMLGHEGSGVVLEIGEGVTKVKPGDTVILSWLKSNVPGAPGAKYTCQETGCIINSGPISTFMSKTIVSQDRVYKMPEGMPLDIAALFGCAIPTGAGIVLNQMEVSETSSVAIFGIGGIGLTALLAAATFSPQMLIAIDTNSAKLELAKSLGATTTINCMEEDAEETLRAYTNGKGVDFALESVGNADVMRIAFNSVRDGGGKCIIAGNVRNGETIAIDPFGLIRGKQIVGTWGGNVQYDDQFAAIFQTFEKHTDSLNKLIGKISSVDRVNEIMDELEKGHFVRGLIKFS